ncbi:ABC transporter ATP-binding protein [Myroides phaeus]|uniref:ABC-2 type transport system ATP-binding protein n=1 Tax=Myroides phaeus TaxID=702745 RepID=A0A1G8B0T7_9FLAO|nr:ABC transporter ATP-binding protein [Myroides phaeus]MEC4115782.1 ABC transporter ATP-binding protein [Myroides phaeus]SDH26892.1 ABC-2 type transport system ATP-binding protein [Myroides phaeus]
MITVNNISKSYNGKEVLNIDHLKIPAGQSIGLVGNNGAGKTTLFSLLLDLIQPSTGNILSKEVNVSDSETWKSYTSAFLDESFLIGYLTAEEYFSFVGELKGLSKEQIVEQVGQYTFFFNEEVLNQRKYVRDFSKGNQKKIGIVAAFLGSPELVILDEPFANLDPTTQIRLKELVKQKIEEGNVTIIISSHDLQHTFEVSDRIIALEKGRVKKDVLTSELSLQELEAFFQNS